MMLAQCPPERGLPVDSPKLSDTARVDSLDSGSITAAPSC